VLAALVYAQVSGGDLRAFSRNPNAQALVQTYQLIQDQYVNKLDPAKLDEVLEGGIQGMISALDDRFTHYDPPTLASQRTSEREGEFFGIGVSISTAPEGGALVQTLYKGLPASTAGVRAGDVIIEVNNEDITKKDISAIVAKIRGPKGSKVTIGIKRPGANTTLRFEMFRDLVKIINVSKAMLPGNVGYVALAQFDTGKVGAELRQAIGELKAQGAQKLIFDLRDNPGGYLDQACEVTSAFVKSGPIVFTKYRTRTDTYCEADGKVAWSGPLVALINSNSASASEIVSGAIQDTGRGKVVGEKSFGKGVGQSITPLPNGGEVALVTFEWLTPKSRSINKNGVKPDVEVADNRFPVPPSFEGSGLKAGTKVSFTVEGKTYTATADDKGKFSYSQPFPARPTSDDRSQALVDPATDAILKRALDELK
jgi:carboxyl-terminal processing protease